MHIERNLKKKKMPKTTYILKKYSNHDKIGEIKVDTNIIAGDFLSIDGFLYRVAQRMVFIKKAKSSIILHLEEK